ncbi:MAG: hypothetical protein P857_364 [Candidatus Xenolissoclinum pacificiensis L6]|uniref:tRNA uridine(34) hydroxylase n=1 Tax=Candidatus Xenolissoclinum pacificiensis L6 TaxID=1401685 RepID=W2UZP5_9RICK|nr:MAG: hypothetical protein P857_364 [Candidatus Xenolissoclinum pacificiensis L6]
MAVLVTFYKLVFLEDHEYMQKDILEWCLSLGLKGTILLSEEGINATVASDSMEIIDAFFKLLRTEELFSDVCYQVTCADFVPFRKMKVRLKREVVSFEYQDHCSGCVGKYVDPCDWDDLISREETVLLDVRNSYETNLGTFEGAVIPGINYFREYPKWTQGWVLRSGIDASTASVAMFCTGGIRCEKSSKYFSGIGFKNVYHLKGGIINYLLYKKKMGDSHLWKGNCFVFDDRVALDGQLKVVDVKCDECGIDIGRDDVRTMTRGYVTCTPCTNMREQ